MVSIKKTLTNLTILISPFLIILLFTYSFRIYPRTTEEAQLEAELGKRLESMLSKLIGSNKCIVSVKLSLRALSGTEISSFKTIKRQLPGVATPSLSLQKNITEEDKKRLQKLAPFIDTISISIQVDESLTDEEIGLIKKNVPIWMGLNLEKGDELRIERVKLKGISPEEVSLAQIKISKRNLIILIVIAILTGTVGALLFPGFSKLKKTMDITAEKISSNLGITQKGITQEANTQTLEETLSKIAEVTEKLGQTSAGNVQELLREIIEAQKASGEEATSKIVEALSELRDSLTELGTGREAVPGAGAGGMGAGGMGAGGMGAGGMGGEGGTGLSKLAAEAQDPTTKALYLLSTFSSQDILKVLENEPDNVKAVVISNLAPAKSAEVLLALENEERDKIASLIAEIPEGDIQSLETLKDFLDRKATIILHRELLPPKAAKAIAKMLSRAIPGVRTEILENLRRKNPELADEIEDNMFLFEDVGKLDERTIKNILIGVDRSILTRALAKAEDKLKEKILSTLTPRARNMLLEDIEALGDIPHQQAIQAQNIILDRVETLIKEGKLFVSVSS